MATLRSTENFTESATQIALGLRRTNYNIEERTRLVSSISTKSMTYKESDVVFSFESYMNVKWLRVRVVVKLMKKGIIIHSKNALRIGASTIDKIYYLALLGEEATFANVQDLGHNFWTYAYSYLNERDATSLFNDYIDRPTNELRRLIFSHSYIKFMYTYGVVARTREVDREGAVTSHFHSYSDREWTSYALSSTFMGSAVHHGHLRLCKSRALSIIDDITSLINYRVVENELVLMGRTYRPNLAARNLYDRLVFFELPNIFGVNKEEVLTAFEGAYSIKEDSIDIDDYTYENCAANGASYPLFAHDHNGMLTRSVTDRVTINSETQIFNLDCFDGTIGRVIKLSNSRWLVEASIANILDFYDEEYLTDVADNGYEYIIYAVDSLTNVDLGMREYTYCFIGDKIRNAILEAIATSGIWNHFKVKY